jgi:hypothetical protein
MSRVEDRNDRSQGRPASLNEARRARVNPDLRSVVLGSQFDNLDLREQVAIALLVAIEVRGLKPIGPPR